ncbi:MAG: 1-deoxy-D-xylulose-5-phosphate reductoisomerase [Deltaproteobacteria bacterium RIFCSPHIGHO2_12_FULL_43_9]|nr:MAG: 1-deoxy-D-xylulose-5-phosphate reductoisomerase [Deltaproteobacteria bacterium RIFCSPHIGHO2_12_FULL_43_9]
MRYISILGSTGSVGEQTLDIIRNNKDHFRVHSLTAFQNFLKLSDQIKEFSPKVVVTGTESNLEPLFPDVQFRIGGNPLTEVVTDSEIDLVVLAIVGIAALKPLEAAIKAGKSIALANKESIVAAGHLLMPMVKNYGAQILPIDSEHNAIFRIIKEREKLNISSVTLMASGGPFLNRPLESFRDITPDEAIRHPHWSMGEKISVDSATMMNKGLEIFEARWLFNLKSSEIKTLIHPECEVHAKVEFDSGESLVFCGKPDMREPIGFTLFWPQKAPAIQSGISDFSEASRFRFLEIDRKRFPAFRLAREVLQSGSQSGAIILNAANEVAVDAFLSRNIRFSQIHQVVESSLSRFPDVTPGSILDVFAIDSEVKIVARGIIRNLKGA